MANKVGRLLSGLYNAEQDLAQHYRVVAERQAAEHDLYYLCNTLAQQADEQAARVRRIAEGFGEQLAESGSTATASVRAGLRRKASQIIGRQPTAGLLLLRDLRDLYLMAEAVNVHWLALGQVAQAVRDHELLDEVSGLHEQMLTQIKWIKTRIKESVPQVLLAG